MNVEKLESVRVQSRPSESSRRALLLFIGQSEPTPIDEKKVYAANTNSIRQTGIVDKFNIQLS